MSTRERNGRFAKGNPGGPGRPRRTVEREYLAVLADRVPLSRWQKIIDRAVADAESGDWRARAWLAKYLLGPDLRVEAVPRSHAEPLSDLAVREAEGRSIEAQIEARVASNRIGSGGLERLLEGLGS